MMYKNNKQMTLQQNRKMLCHYFTLYFKSHFNFCCKKTSYGVSNSGHWPELMCHWQQ